MTAYEIILFSLHVDRLGDGARRLALVEDGGCDCDCLPSSDLLGAVLDGLPGALHGGEVDRDGLRVLWRGEGQQAALCAADALTAALAGGAETRALSEDEQVELAAAVPCLWSLAGACCWACLDDDTVVHVLGVRLY